MTIQSCLRLFVMLGSFSTLTGCLGVGALRVGSFTMASDNRSDRIVLRGEDQCCDFDYWWASRSGPLEIGEEDVLRAWGEPDEIRRTEQTVVWVYRHGIAFGGAVITIGFVPIPLVAPVGRQQTEVGFEDGVLTAFVREHIDVRWLFFCGLFYDWSGRWSPACGNPDPQ